MRSCTQQLQSGFRPVAGFRALGAKRSRCARFRGARMTSSRLVGAVFYFQPLQISRGKGEARSPESGKAICREDAIVSTRALIDRPQANHPEEYKARVCGEKGWVLSRYRAEENGVVQGQRCREVESAQVHLLAPECPMVCRTIQRRSYRWCDVASPIRRGHAGEIWRRVSIRSSNLFRPWAELC